MFKFQRNNIFANIIYCNETIDESSTFLLVFFFQYYFSKRAVSSIIRVIRGECTPRAPFAYCTFKKYFLLKAAACFQQKKIIKEVPDNTENNNTAVRDFIFRLIFERGRAKKETARKKSRCVARTMKDFIKCDKI